MKKSFRVIAARGRRLKFYGVVAACFLLIAVQVATAVLFFRLMPLLAILGSNALTVVLLLPVLHQFVRAYDSALAEKEREIAARISDTVREQESRQALIAELQTKNDALAAENKALQSQLDTTAQTAATPANINFVFKLETMEYLKKGYVVKKETIEAEKEPLLPVPLPYPFSDSKKEILYIHKYYYKVAIGIDFANIKFCERGNRLVFYGVKFTKLHDLTSECVPDENDINLCEVRKVGKDRTRVVTDEKYDVRKSGYEKERAQEIKRQLDADVAEKCRQYTKVFRDNIRSRYADIDFVDDEELAPNLTLYSLNSPANPRISGVASTMLMLATVIQETRSIDNGQLADAGA